MRMIRAPRAVCGVPFALCLFLSACSDFGVQVEQAYASKSASATAGTSTSELGVQLEQGPASASAGSQAGFEATITALRATITALEAKQNDGEALETAAGVPQATPAVSGSQTPAGTNTAMEGGLTFDSAPLVQPGVYNSMLKQGETRFFRFDVLEGQRVLASASLIGQPDASALYIDNSNSSAATFAIYDFQRAEVRLQDGNTEVTRNDRYLGATGATFGVATVPVSAGSELQPGRYYLALSLRDSDQQLDGREFSVEVGISIQGPGTPAASTETVAPGATIGGLSFDSAPLVRTGRYTGAIKAGETRFYSIDVANGQRLRASATMLGQPDARDAFEGKSSRAVTISFMVYNSQRAPIELPEGVTGERNPQYGGMSNESFGVDLGPIGGDDLEPGRYYVALRLRDVDNVITGREFQTEYGFEVSGP